MPNPTRATARTSVELKEIKFPPRLNKPPNMRPRVGAKLYTYPAQKTMETLPANHPKAKEKYGKSFVKAHRHQICFVAPEDGLMIKPQLPKPQKETLFETYIAPNPRAVAQCMNGNPWADQPQYHSETHANNNLVPQWWWNKQRAREDERNFNQWMKF